jgi:hypothetical protein
MTEKNSSLFDNEIKEEEISSLISSEIKKPNMRSQWFYYQTIRDVVRREYSGPNNLSKKIMDAIDKEPTQMRGYNPVLDKELAISFNSYNWQLILGFAVLFAIVFAGLNSKNQTTVTPVQLVYEEMPAEIMNAHYANTSSTANYFVQTTMIDN